MIKLFIDKHSNTKNLSINGFIDFGINYYPDVELKDIKIILIENKLKFRSKNNTTNTKVYEIIKKL